MFCMKCGKKIHDTSNFCRYCGAPQLDAEDTVQPPVIEEGWRAFDPEEIRKQPVIEEDFEPLFPDLSGFDFSALDPIEEPEEDLDIPTLARAVAGEFLFYGEQKLREGKYLDVETRFNDREAEDTDPMHFLFSSVCVTRKMANGSRKPVPELQNLTAYVLLQDGICYAKNGEIVYLKEDGTRKVVGRQDNVLQLSYNGFLNAGVFRKLLQISSGEHRDLMGYMYEAWYDVYLVDMEEKQYLL